MVICETELLKQIAPPCTLLISIQKELIDNNNYA